MCDMGIGEERSTGSEQELRELRAECEQLRGRVNWLRRAYSELHANTREQRVNARAQREFDELIEQSSFGTPGAVAHRKAIDPRSRVALHAALRYHGQILDMESTLEQYRRAIAVAITAVNLIIAEEDDGANETPGRLRDVVALGAVVAATVHDVLDKLPRG
jgi:chromosome segregation ATPase